ncbi:hypothetical protein BCV70DRAFT_198539 [Testicularia cyperi]|uniref:Uncharacterized protein n=1 Tax=Testicularia cyperi TaxID=1882483 RepID=A0A317XVY6_9BASI|nr:hypothetical protein BCV70DRAFT_198539 [Testicularia cyperi]
MTRLVRWSILQPMILSDHGAAEAADKRRAKSSGSSDLAAPSMAWLGSEPPIAHGAVVVSDHYPLSSAEQMRKKPECEKGRTKAERRFTAMSRFLQVMHFGIEPE